MDKRNIQAFLMVSAAFLALNASAQPAQPLLLEHLVKPANAVVAASSEAQGCIVKS